MQSFFGGIRRWILISIDTLCYLTTYSVMCVLVSYSSSSLRLPDNVSYIKNALIILACLLISRLVLRVYNNVWRYANSKSFLIMLLGDAVGGICALLVTRFLFFNLYLGVWQTVSVVSFFFILTLCTRLCYQQYHRFINSRHDVNKKINVAIVGAGQLGSLLAEELLYHRLSHYQPLCFIDRDREKVGSRICGLRVFRDDDGVIDRLKAMPVKEIFIALPGLEGDQLARTCDFYAKTGCKIKIYDFPMKDMAENSGKRVIREIRPEDLLFRKSISLDSPFLAGFFTGKTVLVTGGGGSIGSELCRQIAAKGPKKLIVLDIYENNAYALQQELIRLHGDRLDLAVEIASVRDEERMDAIMCHYRPDIVFHAAAHKHVPLMEGSACEAIKNNVFGTYNTANVAEKYGVKKFILISTDKAVNPTNVMGASKRLCEMVVHCRKNSETCFAAVRFGNVLGSNGSVIPLFSKQIEEGGPVTLTDKRIVRYFMTIPEAVQLVMDAGAMAKSGELFVLDMGKPVHILELAENMIRLAGLEPYRDIDIVEIGLRPGEKLYEELLIEKDSLTKTDNNLIFVEHEEPLSREDVEEKLELLRAVLRETAHEINNDRLRAVLKTVVPTYYDPAEVNAQAVYAQEMKAARQTEEKKEPALQNA